TPESQPTTISFKANTDAIADNIQTLVDAYNGILEIAGQYSDDSESGAQGRRLAGDMSSVSLSRKTSLEEIGLMVAEDGSLSIDKEILADAVTDERAEDTFRRLAEFKDAVGTKASSAAIDPMRYVNKVVVEYKNPGKNFSAPYISSIYSGMMLDSYI
ncbi:MAG: flagellar filament capping protein FliD, partial [Lachnospiraceae bacterium]|nr:flagellar filament capping protein FliD [Lachnospiraceae bacterium]